VLALHELRKLTARAGRHRRPDPPAQVTLVLRDGREIDVPPESALARSMGRVADLLAHW
jgi:hypothetical protein